ncbi:hypothetical protein LWI29_013233 [Acer saccharum]|uniref:Secreted protein n=1 Tax=Acer saccharum TaxID=4024 RepID=A0AA39W6B8_ACESA|nr:hypothetical protein LWI29_013233 [Acer saccharum]
MAGLLPIVFPVSLTGLSIAGIVPTSTIVLNPSPVVLNPSPVILKPRRALPDPSGCIYSLSHRDPTRPDPRQFFLQHRPTSPIGPSDTDVRRPTVVLPDPTTCVVPARRLCSPVFPHATRPGCFSFNSDPSCFFFTIEPSLLLHHRQS